MSYTKITSKDDLRKYCLGNEMIEGFIQFGIARSSKRITYSDSQEIWYVYHEIDDTESEMTEQEFDKSNLGKAIRKGAFFLY